MDAPAILAKLDDNEPVQRPDIKLAVTSQEPGKQPREMAFSVQLREKTLTEFSAPGDIKGTRVLVLSRSQMYIYLPAYRKVRRIAITSPNKGLWGQPTATPTCLRHALVCLHKYHAR